MSSPFPFPFPFPYPMALDHERLEVYQAALEWFDLIDEIVEQPPRGRGQSPAPAPFRIQPRMRLSPCVTGSA